MPFRIDNAIVLIGLFALAIPIVLHFFQRRRFDTLDWGAMQFLPDSFVTQRRRWLDEILLMLLRMGMIALIVLALATPISTSPWLAGLTDRSSRDIVFVIDGSYSMDVRVPGQATPWAEAERWMRDRIANAAPSERFAVLVARESPAFVQEEFARELDVAMTIKPDANPDMPRALAEAWRHLRTRSKSASQEIIVVTDGQRHGWADAANLSALESLDNQWHDEREASKTSGDEVPTIRVIKVGEELPKDLANYALAPLHSSRSVVRMGQKVTLRSALHLDNFPKYQPPKKITVAVNNVVSQQLSLPENVDLKKGQIPLAFQHRFDKAGKYAVSLTVDADDALPGDNVQQTSINVVNELRVLCIDGENELSPTSPSFYLQRAMSAPAKPYTEMKSSDLMKPAVVVLADVPKFSVEQAAALERFVAEGGGLLVVTGERTSKNRDDFNEQNKDWLPAKLLEVGVSKNEVVADARSWQHPALELFRTAGDRAMQDARFSKWTKVELDPKSTLVATFTNGEPFLIEKLHKKGRVILCTVPLDRSWGSAFPSNWEFPVFVHELTYYLAGGQSMATQSPRDLRESDLTRCSVDDWRKVRERLSSVWRDEETPTLASDDTHREELWWLLLAAVIGLLCVEVWMTRRMALARS
jgi:hypothetical protein